MDQRKLYDEVAVRCSRMTTRSYSTSFSLGILCLHKDLRDPIYSIYGFVRFADEIVDTLHDKNKVELLERFRSDTFRSIDDQISLNPILQSFQITVHRFNIDHNLIAQFLKSMEMDLTSSSHDQTTFDEYVLGSAEVVGLMCLKVFCEGDQKNYEKLKSGAMKLGAAFQKINFLRDLNADYNGMGRTYFPGVDLEQFDDESKVEIEKSIQEDFYLGYLGLKNLPRKARLGVYVAYLYYMALFKKIKNTPSQHVLKKRIRIRNRHKLSILCYSYMRHQFNMI